MIMEHVQIQQFDVVTATFRPARTIDLREGARSWVGRRLAWQAVGVIEDGAYAEQQMMMPLQDHGPHLSWVPASDLVDIVPASH